MVINIIVLLDRENLNERQKSKVLRKTFLNEGKNENCDIINKINFNYKSLKPLFKMVI